MLVGIALLAAIGGCGAEDVDSAEGRSAAAGSGGLDSQPSDRPATASDQPEWEAQEEAEEGIHPATDAAADRLARFEFSPAEVGFGSVAVHYDKHHVDVWWHGPLPGRVRAAVAEIRRAGLTVKVHRAVHSKAQFQQRVDRIFSDRELKAAGLRVFTVIGNLALSSVEIHIAAPGPGLTSEEKAARCALASRLARAASGLRVRKVDDRGDVLEVNSPNPCGAPGLRNIGHRSAPAGAAKGMPRG